MAMEENRALDWDSEIENDGEGFVLLDPGIYSFTVTDLERAQFAGNDKAPQCPMAKLTLRCEGVDGSVGTVKDSLFLTTRNEWKLCQFFTSIGQRKHGEKLKPAWNQVLGATGMLELEYDKKVLNDDGTPKYNRVKAYKEPTENSAPVAPQKKWQIGK